MKTKVRVTILHLFQTRDGGCLFRPQCFPVIYIISHFFSSASHNIIFNFVSLITSISPNRQFITRRTAASEHFHQFFSHILKIGRSGDVLIRNQDFE